MAQGIGIVRLLGWRGTLRVAPVYVERIIWIVMAAALGAGSAIITDRLMTWPYPTPLRRMVGEGGATSDRELVRIHQGGDIVMQRLITYEREDCERWYVRRVVSEVPDERGAVRAEPLPLVYDPRLPGYLSGEWQEWRQPLPAGFPCGRAYLAETVTASCHPWLHGLFPLTKPDIKTPFEVVGCLPG